jgi:hypothetical protein
MRVLLHDGGGGSDRYPARALLAGEPRDPRQGCGRWGGVDERRVGTADGLGWVRIEARRPGGLQRLQKRWKPVWGTGREMTRDTGVRPFWCMLVHPTPRHALGQGRRCAFRHSLSVVMSRVPVSWGPWVTPPSRCLAAPMLSRLDPVLTARGLRGAYTLARRRGRDREAHHRQPPKRLLVKPRTTL